MLKKKKRPEFFRFRYNLIDLIAVLHHSFLFVFVCTVDVVAVVLVCPGS